MKKDSKKYVPVISWKKIDICKFTEDYNTLPIIKDFLIHANESLTGLVHKCPYTGIALKNITYSLNRDQTPMFLPFMPNGEVKLVLLIYNNRDKNIATIQLCWTRWIV